MKKLLTISLFLSLSLLSCGQTRYLQAGQQDSAFIHQSWGWTSPAVMYIYLPSDYYKDSTKKFPIIFWFSGNGQKGNGDSQLPLMLTDGLPLVIKEGNAPYAVNKTTKDTTWFIVSSYQNDMPIYPSQMGAWFNSVLSPSAYGLRVDTNRIYFAGLSQGGWDELGGVNNYEGVTAAAVISMSPAHSIPINQLSQFAKTPIWFFQGDADNVVGQQGTINYDNLSSANQNGQYKLTQYVGGHCCWTQFLHPSWADNDTTRQYPSTLSESVYQWLNQFSLNNDSATSSNPANPPIQTVLDTPNYKISLSPYAKFWNGDTVFYQLNDLTAKPYSRALIDEQDDDPKNGIITPVPVTGFGSGYSTRQGYPDVAVIDLGGLYKISDLYFYMGEGTDSINVCAGSPNHWDKPLTWWANGRWVDVDTSGLYTRYLKIYYSNVGYQKITEMMLYGHLIGDSLSRTPPSQKYYQYADGHTMNNFIGLNEAGAIPYYLVTNVSGLQRDYADQYYLDTSHVHDINKVNFVFDKFSANSTTVSYYFPSGTNGEAGTKQYYTYPNGLDSGMYKGSGIDGNPPYFLPALQSVNQMESDSGWKRSIDYTVHPNADSTNPGSYDRFSRMAWMLGAAFGSNKYPMDSLQYTIPANNISGLDNMSYVETGNENDGDWLGADTWYSPQAFIAYSSAFYDGNDGLMGSRMGIKNSDPNIKVVMAGNAYEYYDYLRTMRYWSYYSRPDHKIPFDVYNFHDYNYIPNTPHSAFQPENYNRLGYSNIRSYWQTVVDSAHEVCPRCDVWETEWGYDRNSNLTNAVPFVPGQDSAEVQGNWVARSWIMQSFVKGLGASFYYMFANANGFHYDSGAYNNYSTCGLIDGSIYGNPCCSINAYAFPAYYYQSTIFHVLNNYIPDSIIYENGVSDSIYEYRYRNASYPDSVAYVVWSGTVSNKRDTLNMNMGSNAVRIQLEDKYLNGEMTAMHPDSTGNILLFISETPQIILSLKGADQGVLSKPVVPTVNSPTTTIYKLTFKQIIDVNGKIEVIFTDPSTGKNYGYILPLN